MLLSAPRGLASVPGHRARNQGCRAAVVARSSLHHHDPFAKSRFPLHEGLPLSLFHPYKKLPPDGTTLPEEEEKCDPEEASCKTAVHVYEARCTSCDGTGWARAPTNGRRGQLGTCILCHGLGYVRRTTSRFCPDDPDKHMTINRPLTWNGKFAARRPPINVEQRLQQQQQQQQQQQGGSGGPLSAR